ncbi:hypothetical protein Tco_1459363 [Tanacetum coccineum]
MSFSKRQGNNAVCYIKPLDSLKSWNDHLFWVDAFACPASFPWNTSKSVSKDPFPKSFEFNAEHYDTLVAYLAPFHKNPEPLICLIGISRNYTLDEDTYPQFLRENGEEMDLLSFIQTADPTKVRVGERQRAEDEPKLLDTTVGRVVPLLSITPARVKIELDASVDRLFDEGGSGNLAEQGDSASGGHGVGIPLVSEAAKTIVEDVAPLQPRRRKRKTVVPDAGGSSHPPKKLREDYRTLSITSIGGKSMSAVQRLLAGAVQNAEVRGEPILTLPFVTSSVSATPESKDEVHTYSATGLNLQTINAPQRFVISSESSHHSGANIAEAEVDSFARSSVPLMTVATTVTCTANPATTVKEKFVESSVFGGNSSGGGADHTVGGFSELIVGGAARQMSLSAKSQGTVACEGSEAAKAIRLRTEASKFEVAEKSLRDEVKVLKEQNAALEQESTNLGVKVADLAASVKVREQEVADLDAQVVFAKSQSDNLAGRTYSVGLQKKVTAYENFIDQLEKLQDEKIKEVNEKFDKLSAISKAVENGMQEGMSARITHGAEGRTLTDVVAYNQSAKADYLSALQRLQSVNFSLIAELKTNKDASIDTIINLLRLEDTLAKRLDLTESQSHVNHLMVPIHHSPDQRVVGASAFSLSLDVSSSRVWKIKENIANHVSALCDVFIPLSEPLSVVDLEGTEGTSGAAPDTVDPTTALSIVVASTSTVRPISIDDYEVTGADDQATADGNVADEDANPFPNVNDAELNVPE